MTEEPPDRHGLGCATISAIVVPVIAVALFITAMSGEYAALGFILVFALLYGAPIAAAHVILLFLPIYLFAKRDPRLSWPEAAVLGLVCGGLPAFLLSGAEPIVSALFAVSGLIGGLAFRATFVFSRI